MAVTTRNNLLVWAVVGSQFGPPFMFSGVAVALPSLAADLGAGATSLGLIETLFLAGSVAGLLPLGRLADAGDRRALYKLGLLSFAVTSLLIGALSSLPVILALRFLQGIASAAFAVTGPAILADLVPAAQRGRVYGRSMAAVYCGLALGPVLAGFLVGVWGWRAVFGTGAAAIVCVSLPIHLLLPSRWRRPAGSQHLPGTALVLAAVLCLVAGSTTVADGLPGYALLVLGLVLGALFILLQRHLQLRGRQPLVDVDALLHNPVLCSALSVQLLLYVNAFATVFLLSIFLQVTLACSAELAGLVLTTGTVVMAVVAPVAGMAADRLGPGPISSSGAACLLVSTLLAATLCERSGLPAVGAVLVVQGLGFGLFSSPNMTLIMNSVPAAALGMASALAAKARSLGMISGMLVAAVLISLAIGNDPVAQHPLGFARVMVTAFVVLAVLTAVALLVSLLTTSTGGR